MLSNGRVQILLVDDHPVVREGLARRLGEHPDLQVCGEATSALEALQLLTEKKADIVITDISLQKSDGIDLIKRIIARDGKIPILVWSMHSEATYAERVIRAGAKGYLTKEQPTDQVVAAIRQVLAGKVFLSPAMNERLLQRSIGIQRDSDGERTEALSDREVEVLRLIGKGSSNDEIGKQLHISVKTVDTYKDRIKKKLHLKSGTELLQYSALWVAENS